MLLHLFDGNFLILEQRINGRKTRSLLLKFILFGVATELVIK